LVLAVLALAAHAPAADRPAELGPAPARLWVIAPAARGAWLLRIDNEGDEPLRIAADVRLLRLEVRPLKNGEWGRRAEVCDGPKAFGLANRFPERRELLLEPGQSYIEQFDPRLICFGKQARLLAPGALVRPTYGWKPPPRWSRARAKPPFVADGTRSPRRFRPLRQLAAPTMLLSWSPPMVFGGRVPARSYVPPASAGGEHHFHHATPLPIDPPVPSSPGPADRAEPTEQASGPDPAGQPGRKHRHGRRRASMDELRARFAITASGYADARHGRDVVVSVETHNAGERPALVALRRRHLSFEVYGPDGLTECPRRTVDHVVPPDFFRKLGRRSHVQLKVLLGEACPPGSFDRPGLYTALPRLHADETGRAHGLRATTGEVGTNDRGPVSGRHREDDDATLIRVTRGRLPFYQGRRPRSVPTEALAPRAP